MTTEATKGNGKRGRPAKWPKIVERSGGWEVDCGRVFGPQRLRRMFRDREAAEAYAADRREARKAQAVANRFEASNRAVSLAALTDDQRADVLSAFKRLAGTATLAAAADFFMEHAAPAGAKTVAEVVAELVRAAEGANRRARTVSEIKWRLTGFAEDFGARPVASLTVPDVERWIDQRTDGTGPTNRDNWRRGLGRLFRFAVKRQYCKANPVAALERITTEETMPRVHTPAQVAAVLASAVEHAPAMVPYLALGYFAGLRPENELRHLQWRNVDLAAGRIHVDPATAKKRRARYVEIADNLREWLVAYRGKGIGQVFYSRRAMARVLKHAEGVEWSQDVMRHTFGSAHFGTHSDAAKTAAALGHRGDTDVLFDHYRALVTPEDAAKYWQIVPPSAGKIVRVATAS